MSESEKTEFELPKGMKWLEDGNFEVKTRKRTFVLQLIKASEMEKAEKLSKTRNGIDKVRFQKILLSKMIIEPKELHNSDANLMEELDLHEFGRLGKAVDILTDIDGNFL